MEHEGTSQWADLTHDLLHEIAKILYSYDDYCQFRAVCKKWNSLLPQIPKRPWLLLPFKDKALETRIVEKKIYYVKLPEMQKTVSRGSCFGWLMVIGFHGTLRMLNPFTRKHKDLPPIFTFPDIFEYNPERGNPYTIDGLKYIGDNNRDGHHDEQSNKDGGHHDEHSNEDDVDGDEDSYDEGDDINEDSYDESDEIDKDYYDDDGDDDSKEDSDEEGDDVSDGDYDEESDDSDTIYYDTPDGTFRVSNKHILKYYIDKIVISSAPDDNYNHEDFIAIAIYGQHNRLAFCKYGDNKWTDIPKSQKDDVHYVYDFEDAIFHQGKIYVIDVYARIFEIDIKNNDTPLGRIIEIPKPHDLNFYPINWKLAYLIGCLDGGLLMVIRHLNFYHVPKLRTHITNSPRFDIYKLEKGAKQWSRVFDLKNYAILIGFNSSVLMSDNIFPNGWENRIHYTDNILQTQWFGFVGGNDIGVFSFNDGKSSQLFPDKTWLFPTPLWLLPL